MPVLVAKYCGSELVAGAVEFWLCDEKGRLTFYDPDGIIGYSRLVKGIPCTIALD